MYTFSGLGGKSFGTRSNQTISTTIKTDQYAQSKSLLSPLSRCKKMSSNIIYCIIVWRSMKRVLAIERWIYNNKGKSLLFLDLCTILFLFRWLIFTFYGCCCSCLVLLLHSLALIFLHYCKHIISNISYSKYLSLEKKKVQRIFYFIYVFPLF